MTSTISSTNYPRGNLAHDNLSLDYWMLGQHQKSLEQARAAMQIYPKDSYGVMNMARAYVSLNRFDEAQSILDQATAQHLDSRGVHTANFRLALLRGDENTIKKDLEQVAGHYEEPELYLMRAEDLCLRGKIRETRQSYTRALDSARTQNMKEYRANIFESEAGCEVDVGFLSQARLEVNAALAESQDRNAKTGAAYVLARLGDEAKTNEILDDLDKASPASTASTFPARGQP